MRDFNIIIQQGEDGYFISEVMKLPGCHTQAKSMDELIKATKEAILLFLDASDKTVKNMKKFVGVAKKKNAEK